MTVEEIAKKLGISISEAEDVKRCDERIDKGEKLFELSEEQKKASKEVRSLGRKVGVKNTRPPNEDKRFLISMFYSALVNSDNEGFGTLPIMKINNAEREIEFVYNDKKYKLVLSCPRK